MKYKDIISKMTLEEKAVLLSGKNEWQTREIDRLNIPNIPNMVCADGPHGIRKQEGEGDHLGLHASVPATCFPTAATIANSWDEALGEDVGKALGEEASAFGVNILLGPGLNIKRSPLCGRNFEYFSEDPYLAGKMTASYVRGIQEKGVYSCIKHFAVNSQEEIRMAMNSVVDDRTLREIYLTGFEIGIKEGKAKAIMTSYNMVNGTYANENEHLLVDILRDDFNFDGVVITDWGGSNDHVAGVAAGSNLEMPNPGIDSARLVVEAVKNGKLREEVVDKRVDELLDAIFETASSKKIKDFDKNAHHELAKKAAAESIVLLENRESSLPIRKKTKVAVIGDFAFEPRYQGSGSSLVNSIKVDKIVEIIDSYEEFEVIAKLRGYERTDKENNTLLQEAVEEAKKAEKVLLFFGLDEISESEGLDRTHMRIPLNQIRLIDELYKVNKNIIGIISAGSAIEMPWKDKFAGLIHSYLSGQAGASATLDVLIGKINPSGKLAETYPQKYEDTPSYNYYPAQKGNALYKESIYVGYRYYDKVEKDVCYPFGYGLSYTSFEYSDLTIEQNGIRVKVKNVGDTDGAEIVQLYIGKNKSEIFRAKKELKGFKKVFLKAGEEKEVEISFDDKSFRYWNILSKSWEVESGEYQLLVGANSRDIRQTGSISIEGSQAKIPCDKDNIKSYFEGKVENISDEEFEKLFTEKIKKKEYKKKLDINDSISRMAESKSFIGRQAVRQMERLKRKAQEKGKPDLNILFLYNMPFRAIAKMGGDSVSMDMAQSIVDICNGAGIAGYIRLVNEFFRNKKENKLFLKKLKEAENGKS